MDGPWPAAPCRDTEPGLADGLGQGYCNKTEDHADGDTLAGKKWDVADTYKGRPHLEAVSHSQAAQENQGILGSGGNEKGQTTDNNNAETAEQFLGRMGGFRINEAFVQVACQHTAGS